MLVEIELDPNEHPVFVFILSLGKGVLSNPFVPIRPKLKAPHASVVHVDHAELVEVGDETSSFWRG